MADSDLQRQFEASARQRVNAAISDEDRERSAHVVVETSDQPAGAIIEYAKHARIDLIVTGTHGRTGVAHLLGGSVAERVVRTAPCPVLTVRHPEHEFVLPDAAASTQEVRPS